MGWIIWIAATTGWQKSLSPAERTSPGQEYRIKQGLNWGNRVPNAVRYGSGATFRGRLSTDQV